MKTIQNMLKIAPLVVLFFTQCIVAQINPGVYISDVEDVRHELKIDNGYLIHTTYKSSPAKFIKTLGGFYTIENGALNVKLEFNSDYETDGLKELTIPFSVENDALTLKTDTPMVFMQIESMPQDLDGQWLFATQKNTQVFTRQSLSMDRLSHRNL